MGCSERDHAQVIISPGLTVTSLISSLSSRVQQSKKVTCVNVHVGINDCVHGRFIRKETWTSVINALRRCFPSAAVNLSSILPLNDTNKHVANCINKTNDGMYHAAWEKGAFFTDNDETFYSRSWEVKSMLRGKKVHFSPTMMRLFTHAAGKSNPRGTSTDSAQTNAAVADWRET